VVTKTGLGGTKICFDALTNDQIDFYPEYTGTGLLAILQAPAKTVDLLSVDKDKTYNYVKEAFEQKFNIKWLKPIGFNNAYALMMREKQANQLHIKTISDLKRYLESNK
jgi:osmoprotectant transport system permease protein